LKKDRINVQNLRLGPHHFLSFAPKFFPDEKQVEEYKRRHPNWEKEDVDWSKEVDWIRDDGKRRKEG
jgi:hypothetical protein